MVRGPFCPNLCWWGAPDAEKIRRKLIRNPKKELTRNPKKRVVNPGSLSTHVFVGPLSAHETFLSAVAAISAKFRQTFGETSANSAGSVSAVALVLVVFFFTFFCLFVLGFYWGCGLLVLVLSLVFSWFFPCGFWVFSWVSWFHPSAFGQEIAPCGSNTYYLWFVQLVWRCSPLGINKNAYLIRILLRLPTFLVMCHFVHFSYA